MITLIRAVAVCTLFLFAGATHAQTGYPNRPVRVIVPFAPGGPSDVIARLLMQKFSENLGQQFYVENHAGGGGNLGTAVAARAAPDGYTILVASSSFMINPGLYAKIPYDPYNDFDPVTEIATTPNVLVVHPSVPAKSVRELIDFVRASSGKSSYANPGTGTPSHLSGEMFKLAVKIDMVAVPFQGGGPMIQSVIGNHTPIAFSSMPPAAPQIKEGRLRGANDGGGRRSGPGRRHAAGHPRPQGRAQGGDRPPSPRNREGDRACRRAAETCRHRVRTDRRHARRIYRADQNRSAEMGEGHPRRQHQTGMTNSSAPVILGVKGDLETVC
jgi:tripartite tricarboxylate transporter family receptor